MMTQQLGFSVLGAPLAAIDRRALSQAWYSALHLGMHAPANTLQQQTATVTETSVRPSHRSFAEPRKRLERSDDPAMVKREKKLAPAPATERRALRSDLARKIESRFARGLRGTHRATFTLEGSRTRILVTLRTCGPRATLVAVCPRSVRETVARALQDARYALAQRGIALDLETREDVC